MLWHLFGLSLRLYLGFCLDSAHLVLRSLEILSSQQASAYVILCLLTVPVLLFVYL